MLNFSFFNKVSLVPRSLHPRGEWMGVRTSFWPKIIKILFPAFLILFFSFYYFFQIDNIPLHPDEHDWVRKSDFLDLYLSGQFSHSAWSDYDAYDQPKLASYFFGGILHLHGWQDIGQRLAEIDFNQGWKRGDGYGRLWTGQKWWIKYQDYPPNALPAAIKSSALPILLVRRGSVVLNVLTLVLAFLIARKVSGWLTGLLALALLGFNPLFATSGLLAMADGLLLFTFTLSLFLMGLFLKKWQARQWKKVFLMAAMIGAVNGLATSTKLNGFLAEGVFALLCFSLGLLGSEQKALKSLLLSLTFALFVFFILDPTLWPNPFVKTATMVNHRILISLRQQKAWPSMALSNPGQRSGFIFKKFFWPPSEYSTFRFLKLPVDLVLFLLGAFLIVRREMTSSPPMEGRSGLRRMGRSSVFSCPDIHRGAKMNPPPAPKALGVSSWGRLLFCLLHPPGRSLGVFAGAKINNWRQGRISFLSVIILWIFLLSLMLIFWVPMNWERYYLPIIPFITLLEAFAMTFFLASLHL